MHISGSAAAGSQSPAPGSPFRRRLDMSQVQPVSVSALVAHEGGTNDCQPTTTTTSVLPRSPVTCVRLDKYREAATTRKMAATTTSRRSSSS